MSTVSKLILPEQPSLAAESDTGRVSIYKQKSFEISFKGWKKDKFPINFWAVNERIRDYVESKQTAGQVSQDLIRDIRRMDGCIRCVPNVATTREQYEFLLEASLMMVKVASFLKIDGSNPMVVTVTVPTSEELQLDNEQFVEVDGTRYETTD